MRSSRALPEAAPIAVGQQQQQQQQDNPQQCQETSLASLSGEESDKNDNVNDNDDQQQPKHEPHNAMNGPGSGDMDSIMELESQDYLPSYLRKLVQHHHGDFFYSQIQNKFQTKIDLNLKKNITQMIKASKRKKNKLDTQLLLIYGEIWKR